MKKPYLINNIIDDNDVFKNKVLKKYNLNNGLPQIDLSQLFPEFKMTVEPYSYLEGGSTTMDLALLKALAIKYNVKDYLEIGTWRGESVANIADVVENCYTVNLPKENILAISKNKNYVDSHCFFSKNINNIVQLEADSLSFDFNSLNKKFDMIFIDGDHHYNSIKQDTINAFNLLKTDKSIIVWHDYAYNPEEIRWETLNAIFDACPAEKRKYIYHISNSLCAVFIPENIKSEIITKYKIPNKYFKITIELKK